MKSNDYGDDIITVDTDRSSGLTHPVTEISTGMIYGGKARPVCKAENLTAIYERIA
jgi:hypothetical protein